MKKLIAPIAVIIALAPLEARADWQYTKWGMTPEAAVKASNGAMKLIPAKDREKPSPTGTVIVASGTFQDGDIRLRIEFLIDAVSGGLVCVAYAPSDAAQNEALKQLLLKRYGPPMGGMPSGPAPVDLLGWGDPDTIDYQAASGYPAGVVHCKKGGPMG